MSSLKPPRPTVGFTAEEHPRASAPTCPPYIPPAGMGIVPPRDTTANSLQPTPHLNAFQRWGVGSGQFVATTPTTPSVVAWRIPANYSDAHQTRGVPPRTTLYVRARAVGHAKGTGEAAAIEIAGAFKRVTGGALAAMGATSTIFSQKDALAWDLAFVLESPEVDPVPPAPDTTINPNRLAVRVTGSGAVTVQWTVSVEVSVIHANFFEHDV